MEDTVHLKEPERRAQNLAWQGPEFLQTDTVTSSDEGANQQTWSHARHRRWVAAATESGWGGACQKNRSQPNGPPAISCLTPLEPYSQTLWGSQAEPALVPWDTEVIQKSCKSSKRNFNKELLAGHSDKKEGKLEASPGYRVRVIPQRTKSGVWLSGEAHDKREWVRKGVGSQREGES